MTVSAATPSITYAANGVGTVYAYPFKTFLASHLVATLDGVTVTNYTVSGLGADGGGNLTFSPAPLGELVIRRVLPLSRSADYQAGGAFREDQVDQDQDIQTQQIQQVAEESGRSLRLSPGKAAPANLEPTPSTLVGFDAVGVLKNMPIEIGTSIVDLSSSEGASLVGTISSAAGAIPSNQAQINDEELSLFRFLTAEQIADYTSYTGSIDITTAFNTAVAVAAVLKRRLRCPDGAMLITAPINFPVGARIIGGLTTQYNAGFSVAPGGTTINFRPSSANTDLFVANGATHGGFRFHDSIEGFYINGNANARYAFNLGGVIYGRFANISVEQATFQASFFCSGTINNRFENVYTGGTVAAVIYAGNNETTDVWSQCSFWGSPIGVDFTGSSLAIRFTDCLFEQLDLYGMRIAKECQNIIVTNAYAEDVPFTNVGTAAMFKIGYTGTTPSGEPSVTVIGGKFAGRNAGIVGSFLDVDYCDGASIIAVDHSRFSNIINSTANTRSNSIRVQGGSGIAWTTYANDYTKISGDYPNNVNNGVGSGLEARYQLVNSNEVLAADGAGSKVSLAGSLITLTSPGGAVFPSNNGACALGLSSNRWSTVYASTGTINTSDERQKQQVRPIDDAALRAWAKVDYCQFKFNDTVAIKGGGARWHFGVIAQRVKEAFESEGLDGFAYGVLCYDEWPDKFDEQGVLVTTAGNAYGIRYEEALALECAYLRSFIKQV